MMRDIIFLPFFFFFNTWNNRRERRNFVVTENITKVFTVNFLCSSTNEAYEYIDIGRRTEETKEKQKKITK